MSAESSFKLLEKYYDQSDHREYVLIFVDRVKMDSYFRKTLFLFQGQVQLAGFRKGKVPLKLVLSKYYEEISRKSIELAVEDEVKKLVKELSLKFLTPFEIVSIQEAQENDENGLKIKLSYVPIPEVELGKLEDIEFDYCEKNDGEPTNKEVEEYIKDIWYEYVVKQNLGIKKDDYKVEFINNEFLNKSGISKKYPGIVDYQGLKNKVFEILKSKRTAEIKEKENKRLLDGLIGICKFSKYEGLVDIELEALQKSYLNQFYKLGIDPVEYLKNKGTSLEDLREKWLSHIEKNIKLYLAVHEYARIYNISVKGERERDDHLLDSNEEFDVLKDKVLEDLKNRIKKVNYSV